MSDINGITANVSICNCCKKLIISHIEKKLFDKSYHEQCYEFITKHNYHMYNNLEVDVTYKKIKKTHKGSCRARYDVDVITKLITRTYPLYVLFELGKKMNSHDNYNKWYVYDKDTIWCENEKILYEKEDNTDEWVDPGCKCATKYYINDIKIHAT